MTTNKTKESSGELILPPAPEQALAVFSRPEGLDPYLDKIKAELDAFVPDVTTKKGRDAIASLAHKVSRGKIALDNIGKELVNDLKDVPKKIDAERKRMRDLMDKWKDEVRAPLTAWEDAERAREARHKDGIAWFALRAKEHHDLDSEELRKTIAEVEFRAVDESWQEFEAEAHRAKAKAIEELAAALVARKKWEAEQAELARLRAEAQAQEQKDREERIVREAVERTQREAEAKARAEREAAAEREAQAKASAERRELELTLLAERAEREKTEAIQREVQAKADAERKSAEAVAEEQRSVEALRAAEAKEAGLRERDKAHKAAINRAALDAFVACGMTKECAKLAVTLIAKKVIPSVAISY